MTLSDTGDQVVKPSATASYWGRLYRRSAGAVINSSPNAPLLSLSDHQVTNYGDVGVSLTTKSAKTGWLGFLNAGYQFASDYNASAVQGGLRYMLPSRGPGRAWVDTQSCLRRQSMLAVKP